MQLLQVATLGLALAATQAYGTWFKPVPGTSWNWILDPTNSSSILLSPPVQVYDIDLFDTDVSIIQKLHARGSKVICYISVGSWEDWRPDAALYNKSILGNVLDGWPDEKWFDIRDVTNTTHSLRPLLQARFDLAVKKGCDGIEPDNIDGYENDNGFSLTYNEQLTFNKWVAQECHNRNLSVGLKNDVDQVDDLVAYFDFAIDEQCVEYDECDSLLPFVQSQPPKAVFGVEYDGSFPSLCKTPNADNFDWLFKTLDLTESYKPCRSYSWKPANATTATNTTTTGTNSTITNTTVPLTNSTITNTTVTNSTATTNVTKTVV